MDINTIIEKINDKSFSNNMHNQCLFEGADIIVTESVSPQILNWLGEKSLAEATNPDTSGKQIVISKYAKEISWLIFELKKAYSQEIDYLNKYDFYGKIANMANSYIKDKGDDDIQSMLLFITEEISMSNETLKDYDKIGLEWYKYGLQKKDDFFIKFMMHWIAFNWIYDEYKTKSTTLNKYNSQNHTTYSEIAGIKRFVEKNIGKLSEYDAFSTKEIELLKEKTVYSEQKGEVRPIDEHNREMLSSGDELERITALFCIMYTIRCNLFHGSKKLKVERDIALVKASSVLLGGFLSTYYNDN